MTTTIETDQTQLILIQFTEEKQGLVPYEILTNTDSWDVELVRGGKLYRYSSGSGYRPGDRLTVSQYYRTYRTRTKIFPGLYWVADEYAKAVERVGLTRRILTQDLPLEWRTWSGLEESIEETEYGFVGCSKCRAMYVSDTGSGYDPCKHIWFCEGVGWWSTPQKRCGHRRGSKKCQER